MVIGAGVQAILVGMPEPQDLQRTEVDGFVFITVGAQVLFRYASDDGGLRALAAVTLRELGFTGRRVGEVLGITEEYVSMLRSRVRAQGSAALIRRRGRPSVLKAADLGLARSWRAAGRSDATIAKHLGVNPTTVGRALADVARSQSTDNTGAEQAVLSTPISVVSELTEPVKVVAPTMGDADVAQPHEGQILTADLEPADSEPVEPADSEPVEPVDCEPGSAFAGSARVGTGTYGCRYAGAMLLYPYLDQVGAQTIFGTLTGGPARRYDDLAVLTTVTMGFALGMDTVEGSKHLRREQAGTAVGLVTVPQLATLRARLAALADGSDPLGLQRAFATGMLAADPAADPVYFVDDHFVPYSGARPVGKGWNTKRRHAQPGLDDTLLVDARGRAVVFGSGEPTGLVSTLPGVLTGLRKVLGPSAPILLGFDRGGAYPSAFTACRKAGADWLTYRRAPLVAVTAEPRRSWTLRDGQRISVMLGDETVDIKGYGTARQLTLFENGAPVLQVLTSDVTATGAALLYWLRARWRIENMFKYAAEHNGIDTLADYTMDIGPDTRMVTNPARVAARKTVAGAKADLITAERALAQLMSGPGTPKRKNAALPAAHQQIAAATEALQQAKTVLRPIPAKVLATELDPNAQRARPRLQRRGLQMVLRLLAFNAEAWLAEHFNAYLSDPNEYRAILRNLLHLGGQVTYTAKTITVTLDRPDSPRVARALQLLTEEFNAIPTCLPGDRRPLTYQITEA